MYDLLIIDGRHLLYRSADANRTLSAELADGSMIGTGGIFGFIRALLRIHDSYKGKVAVAWEGTNNFRKVLYSEYKRRPDRDEEELAFLDDLGEQQARLEELLAALGVYQYRGVRCEADDVMGTMAEKFGNELGHKIAIYTGDSDLRQLVTDKITVISPIRRKKTLQDVFFTPGRVRERYQVDPPFVADLKALMGDTSDAIPGVKGVGEVTATKLLVAYGDVEGVLAASQGEPDDWPVAPRFHKMITDAADDVRLFLKLTTIKIDAGLRSVKPDLNLTRARLFLKTYKCDSLLTPSALVRLSRLSGRVEATRELWGSK